MKIITVFKTHFDIGYTKLSREVVEMYGKKMIKDVIATCEGTRKNGKGLQYVWTMSSWPLKKTLETASEEDRIKAEELIRNGQLYWHGLPFTTHTEFLTKDELEHGCKIAKELSEKYGVKAPVSAKMTDVPGHAIGLVEVLVNNGIGFLHLGCNPASTPPDVPELFWWENKRGQRVLVMYNKTYGSSIMPPKNWKYPVYLAMQQTNDNIGPQGAECIENLLRELPKGYEMTVGTMDDFYEEIMKCDLSDLPVVRQDLGDTWIHGVGTYPKEVSMLRRARNKLPLIREYCKEHNLPEEELLKPYYDNILLFGEHTWGLDVKTHLGWNRAYEKKEFEKQKEEPRYAYLEESWREQSERAEAAVACVEELMRRFSLKEPKEEYCPNGYNVSVEDGKIVLTTPGGTRVTLSYEYNVIGAEKIHGYMKHYLTRLYGWAIADFGRESYPEIPSKRYTSRLKRYETENGTLTAYFTTPKESEEQYGNCGEYELKITPVKEGIKVVLTFEKPETPYVEAGNFLFETNLGEGEMIITKCGEELNVKTDIRKGANKLLYCIEDEARIGNICVKSIDAPLTSFGKNAIYENNTRSIGKNVKKTFVFNLYNNMWGTNFPQYMGGKMSFEWLIYEK